MTRTLVAEPTHGAAPRRANPRPRGLIPAPRVEVLICGSLDRGDDGAALAAAPLMRAVLGPNARISIVNQLDVDDLLAIPTDAGAVIVDAATGIPAGSIHDLPLRGFLVEDSAFRPRSSHALEMPEVIGLAEMLRGHALVGRIVVIGARQFRLGHPLSTRVAVALPELVRVVAAAAAHVEEALRGQSAPTAPAGAH
jgi:hydrogenase maturation protease